MHRILYVSPVSYIGGGEKALLELMENLPLDIYKPFLVCPGNGPFPDLCMENGIDVHYLTTIPPPGGKASTTYIYLALNAMKIARLVSKLRIDLIHSNSARVAYHGGLGARLSGIPSVIHVRDYINSPFKSRFKSHFLNTISDRVIAVSDATKDSILSNNYFLQKKVTTIYDGIPLVAEPSKDQITYFLENLNIATQRPVLAVIGAISEQKGQMVIIQALPEIKKLFPRVKLLIVGTPRDRQGFLYEKKICEEVQHLGLSEQVIFLGFREDTYVIIKSVDLIVHPAVEPDAFPHTLLEACYLQTPVVASAIGGIPEIIVDGKTGFLCKPGDIVELGSKIIDILSHNERLANIRKLGKERVSESFSMKRHVNGIGRLYQNLVKDA